MINKVLKLAGVGKFENYSASGDVSFKKLTLLFGENGNGKSTLAAVLRSLKTGEAKYMQERKRLGSGREPEAEILVNSKVAKFKDGAWSSTADEILVFDAAFVEANVCLGSKIEHSHKKNLYELIVGDQSVALVKEVSKLTEDVIKLNQQLGTARERVKEHITSGLTEEQFIGLEADPEIDKKLKSARKLVAAYAESEAVSGGKELAALKLSDGVANPPLEILAKELTTVSLAALEATKAHVESCIKKDSRSEQWLRSGLDYIKSDKCPFCGQGLGGVELIEKYRQYFDKEYKELRESIVTAKSEAASAWGDAVLVQLQQRVTANDTTTEFWKKYFEAASPELDLSTSTNLWKEAREALLELLDQKAKNPLEAVVTSERWLEAVSSVAPVLEAVAKYNEGVSSYNAEVQKKKAEVAEGSSEAATKALKRLQDTRERHQAKAVAACADYTRLLTEKRGLEKKKDEAKANLDAETSKLLETHEKEINKYLGLFGADYRIHQFKRNYVGGNANSEFALQINGAVVQVGNERTPEGEPCFGNTLSGGDKSTLAFAIFLACLRHDPKLAQRLVVIDDPISSLDWDRQQATVDQIGLLVREAAQVLVISHEPHFLRSIWDSAADAERKALCVTTHQDQVIEEWDIAEATKGAYFKDYFKLHKFVNHGTKAELGDVARSIRPVLEGNLRMRFPVEFPAGAMLGGFIEKIRDAEPTDALAAYQGAFLDELTALNTYSRVYHHDTNANWSTAAISKNELRTHAQRALEFVPGIVASA
jgi:wobble nucleotide-excising tRNase